MIKKEEIPSDADKAKEFYNYNAKPQWSNASDETITIPAADLWNLMEAYHAQFENEANDVSPQGSPYEIDIILREYYRTNKEGKGSGYGRRVIQKIINDACEFQREIYKQLPTPSTFTREQMEECFGVGVHAGINIKDLPTPRIKFKEFMQSLTDKDKTI